MLAEPDDQGRHPLALQAAESIQQDTSGIYFLPPASADRLRSSLRQLFDRLELEHAVTSMIDLAAHMDQGLQSPKVAEELVAIVRTAVPALRRAGTDESGALSSTPADSLRRFLAAKEIKRAPPVADKPPAAGEFRISAMHRAKIR